MCICAGVSGWDSVSAGVDITTLLHDVLSASSAPTDLPYGMLSCPFIDSNSDNDSYYWE